MCIQNLAVNSLAFNPHYMTLNTPADILMKGIVKIFCQNNHQSKMIYRFLSKAKQNKKQKQFISGL